MKSRFNFLTGLSLLGWMFVSLVPFAEEGFPNQFNFYVPVLPGRSYTLQSSTNLVDWDSGDSMVSPEVLRVFTAMDEHQRYWRVLEETP